MPDAQPQLDSDLDTHALTVPGSGSSAGSGPLTSPRATIHHAAFDAHLIGIDPDFRIHVSDRLLEIHDGPFLELGFKGIVGQLIQLPQGDRRAVDPIAAAK
jgi:hypothetical protein